jgi:hypothetical protein
MQPTDWSDHSDEGSSIAVRYRNALAEYNPPTETVEAVAALAEKTGNRRDARLLRTALKMRQCPPLDLDELTREMGLQ